MCSNISVRIDNTDSEASISGDINTGLSLNIFVDESKRGCGFARILLRRLLVKLEAYLKKEGVPSCHIPDILLYIDTDASFNEAGESFWEYIGMQDSRYYDRNLAYKGGTRGFEKDISVRQLWCFVNKTTKKNETEKN